MCACMVFAQDAKPFKAKYMGNMLGRSLQTNLRSVAKTSVEAAITEDFSKFTKGTE